MLLLDGHPERDRLGRGERGDDVVDRPARDLGRVERRQPVGGRALRRSARRGSGAARPAVSTRSPFVANRGSCGQVRQPERRAQPRPLALRADRDRDRAVGRVERLVRDDVRVGVAEPARRDARDERVLRLVDEAGQRGAQQRDVDPLAARRRPDRSSRSRPTSAASTLTAPSIPVTTSLIATPTLVGPPPSASGAPVIDIRPLAAWTTKS